MVNLNALCYLLLTGPDEGHFLIIIYLLALMVLNVSMNVNKYKYAY